MSARPSTSAIEPHSSEEVDSYVDPFEHPEPQPFHEPYDHPPHSTSTSSLNPLRPNATPFDSATVPADAFDHTFRSSATSSATSPTRAANAPVSTAASANRAVASPNAPSPHPSQDDGAPHVDTPELAADGAGSRRGGSAVLKVGTLVVIGALAANVIGFRNSRWAVGKDVHRAWQNYERAAAQRHSRASSSSFTSPASGSPSASSGSASSQWWRQQQERAHLEQMEAEAREELNRARAMHMDRDARRNAREQHEGWERTFRGPDGSVHQQSFRVEFDPRMFQDMFGGGSKSERRGGNAGSTGSSSSGRNPFGMPEEVLQELLRAAQQQAEEVQKQSGGRGNGQNKQEDFDAFQFWQQMNQSGGFEGSFGGMGSRGGDGVFGRAGLSRHYSVLGLKDGASDVEIKRAYRKEAMKWHPDRYRGDDKEEADRKFREVTEAYNALSGK